MHNLLIINLEKLEQTFDEITQNSPEKVRQWFNKTLSKHWLGVWAERGLYAAHTMQKTFVPKEFPNANDPKWRISYIRVHRALMLNAPTLLPATINGTDDGSIAFKDLNESQLKALGNGAIPAAITEFNSERLIHIRDFLEYFLRENPHKDLSKLTPALLPQMIADWDKQLRRVSEILETAESMTTMYAASNGYKVCVIGSAIATKHVGTVLRNCLRNSPSAYFNGGTLFCIKNAQDKIVAALDVRMYKRVAAVQEGTKVAMLAVDSIKLTQFYGPENEAPEQEAVDAFNEWVTAENIRSYKDVTQLALAQRNEWDADGDANEEGDEDEDDEEEATDDDEDDRPARRPVGRRRAERNDF